MKLKILSLIAVIFSSHIHSMDFWQFPLDSLTSSFDFGSYDSENIFIDGMLYDLCEAQSKIPLCLDNPDTISQPLFFEESTKLKNHDSPQLDELISSITPEVSSSVSHNSSLISELVSLSSNWANAYDSSEDDLSGEEKLERLPPSRTAVFDAVIYCALKNQGASILNRKTGIIAVNNLRKLTYCTFSCSTKPNPTPDERNRIKAISLSFEGICPLGLTRVFNMSAYDSVKFRNRLAWVEAMQKHSKRYRSVCKNDLGNTEHKNKRQRK